jgi:FkbM family methyltransferase
MIPQDLLNSFRDQNFFLVQVGANDGILDDPLHDHIMENQFAALLIEPLPWVFERLRKTYAGRPRTSFLNCAISDAVGTMDLWCLPDDIARKPDWDLSVLATSRRHLFTHELCLDAEEAAEVSSRLIAVTVPCTTLDNIIKDCAISQIGLLQIDTQGHDFEVIHSIDLSTIKPAYINFEHVLLEDRASKSCEYLLRHGYCLFPGMDERYDTLAVLQG